MQTSFLRAPFEILSPPAYYDFHVVDEFDPSGRFILDIKRNQSTSAGGSPAQLQPIFPGRIVFKPAAGQTIPADPRKSSSPTLRGDLFLAIHHTVLEALGTALPEFELPLMAAYLGIELTPAIFTELAKLQFQTLGSNMNMPVAAINTLREAQRLTLVHDFASGKVSILVSPDALTKDPDLVIGRTVPNPADGIARQVLVLGVRAFPDPYRVPPALTEIESVQILTAPAFTPIPVSFFFSRLRKSSEWANIAAAHHANHSFFTALDALELPHNRWRHIRFRSYPQERENPDASIAFLGLRAQATEPAGGLLWERDLDAIGDLFLQRPDGEQFRLQVFNGSTAVPLSPDETTAAAQVMDLEWVAPTSGAAPAAIKAMIHYTPQGDVAGGSLPTLKLGVIDRGGMTIDPVDGTVLDTLEWVYPARQALTSLGFDLAKPVKNEDGLYEYDLPTSWAVREFQIYAKYPTVAIEDPNPTTTIPIYADRLIPVINTAPYSGEITGILDQATAAALRHWLENKYRCPVVVESWVVKSPPPPENRKQPKTLVKENIWLPQDEPTESHRTFVRDLSGYYTLPPHRAAEYRTLLGKYLPSGSFRGVISTPMFNTTWMSDTSITPERLTGESLPAVSTTKEQAEKISTYKVILAVSEAEAEQTFDSLNGWDQAVMSMGVFHWIIFYKSSPTELPAYLAYLDRVDPAEFQKYFGFFGIGITGEWPAAPASPNPFFVKNALKWESILTQRGLPREGAVDGQSRPLVRREDAEYFRSWHWFYRWVMAQRLSGAVQRGQWFMARMRLRELVAAPWGAPHPLGANTRIGQIYSSERAVAALLRAHVNQPGEVISGGKAHPRLRDAYNAADLSSDDPANWNAADKQRLHRELEKELKTINGSILDTLDRCVNLNDSVYGKMDTSVSSFLLYDADLL